MGRITKKIMAFVGTEDACRFVNGLTDYTDDIYAAVSSEYGEAPHPGGNITLISRYLDEEHMESWINRVGVDIIIDGTSFTAAGPHAIIERVSKKLGIEYHRIAAKYEMNMNTTICRDKSALPHELDYAVGKVLASYDADIITSLAEKKGFEEKVVVLAPVDVEKINQVLDLGYKAENLICTDKILHFDFLLALFEEYNVTNFIFSGADTANLGERQAAVNHSSVKAVVYGEPQTEEGMSIEALWKVFAARFGLEDW